MRRLRRPQRKTLDSRLDPRLRTSRTSVGNDRKKEADSFLRQAQDRRFARNDRCGVSLAIFVSMKEARMSDYATLIRPTRILLLLSSPTPIGDPVSLPS